MSIYILGTGLSHDGSTCILKDGEIIVAIEKERLSKLKHDGGNDFLTVQYCLNAAGITADSLSLIVQAANFETNIPTDRYKGKRFFDSSIQVPVHTLSHHLAHAWGAVGSSPFDECNVMVIDGTGSPFDQCIDLKPGTHPVYPFTHGMYCEKDSFYFFNGKTIKSIFKDFSEIKLFNKNSALQLPTNQHSIGGLYSAASNYCFGNMDDAGKLMGLAPYGKLNNRPSLFNFYDGRVEVNYESVDMGFFDNPSKGYNYFREHFQHYADIARWVQHETEKATLYLFEERIKANSHPNMAYAGGVALNAVVNKKLKENTGIKNLYMQPAAGDNGLAIGCAWYGWYQLMGKSRKHISESPFLGRAYTSKDIEHAIKSFEDSHEKPLKVYQTDNFINETAMLLADGKVIGWFQDGAEFGPRALGHRSILADPRTADIKNHINRNIKFREDFRPFAPSVQLEKVNTYFQHGWDSPYMILIDKIKPEWKEILPGIVHEDQTCRVQTVHKKWNEKFHALLDAFEQVSGIGVLLNTSLNRKGTPIVETPLQAIELFYSGALDILVLQNFIIYK